MFFNYIFQGVKFDEETVFCAIESIEEVICFAYNRHEKPINKPFLNDAAILMLDGIRNNNTLNYDVCILDISENLLNFIQTEYPKVLIGATIFAVNLFIKRRAHLMREEHRKLLRAPLNEKELTTIGYPGVTNVVHVNKSNYKNVMQHAEKYATGKLSKKPAKIFNSLYEWELWFWNNN